jgi:hypothetical protein
MKDTLQRHSFYSLYNQMLLDGHQKVELSYHTVVAKQGQQAAACRQNQHLFLNLCLSVSSESSYRLVILLVCSFVIFVISSCRESFCVAKGQPLATFLSRIHSLWFHEALERYEITPKRVKYWVCAKPHP